MEFNIDPYYDDFQQNALDNNYMRILFKPGKAVQARELTQIQSILQNQIKQFGDHVFQDGSPVIGGNMTLDNKVKYLKLLTSFNNTDIEIGDFADRVIRNSGGTVQARVLSTYYPSGGDPTLMVRYVTGNEFTDGDTITVAGEGTQAQLKASQATGLGTVVSINDGVFYVDGYFVKVLSQTSVVDAYSSSANVKIGLQISDDVVDSEVDTTLLDPAQSSFNYQAPGADRYQFNLTLSTRPLDTAVDESQFFELMRVENGVITKQVKYAIYSELEKTLARRTFDESGDYTVKPFRATITDGADSNNYTMVIEPGKAYVKGFEFETIGTFKIDAPKPRSASDVKSLVDVDVDLSYGNYIYVTSLSGNSNGFINIAGLEQVDIHCVDSSKVNANGTGSSANIFHYQNTRIGTARVKNITRYATDPFNATSDSGGTYKLYLSDIDIIPRVLRVSGNSATGTINLSPTHVSGTVNAYGNVTLTILPIRLDAISGVTKAAVYAGSYTVNANSATANVFASPNLAVGDIVRIGDDVREVVSIDEANNRFYVNTEFTRTYVGTGAAAPLAVFKQTAYSQNVTNQTRVITSSAVDNGNVVIYLDRAFDNNGMPDNNTVIQLNFHMDHAESFIAGPVVANAKALGANTTMNVSIQSKYVTGEASLEERTRTALIFPLPRTYAKRSTLNNADYNHNKILLARDPTAPGSGIFRIAQGQGLSSFETIPWADSNSAVQDNLIAIVKDDGGATGVANGDVLQLGAANVTFTGSPVSQIDIDTGITDLKQIDVILRVKENNAEDKIRKKTFHSNTSYSSTPSTFNYPTSASGTITATPGNYGNVVATINVAEGLIFLTDPTYNTVRPGDSISLFVPDVVKVRKVLLGNTTHLPDSNNVKDITGAFIVDYGQRDDIYDHAKLILKQGYDSPVGKMLVHVDYYEHIYQSGSNVTFFSVDSYSENSYSNGSIPVYTSSTGTVYYLRDCLDFRGTRPIGEANTQANRFYTLSSIPAPDETSELSYDYYLPRIDKLVLSKDKEFRIIQGKAAASPLPPADEAESMTLYQINLPPYVSDIREVKTKYFENKRYTMKDISVIDKRLQRVEYFTSLNNVEKLAMADKVQYEDGTEKEKYGLVGENFTNYSIADHKNPDFKVALEGGFMIPQMNIYALGFKAIANTDADINGKTMSLNYTETPAITQGLASNNTVSVQPFLFGQFNGTVKLTPETDFWVSETLKPEILTVPSSPVVERTVVIRDTPVEPPPPPTIPVPSSNASTVVIKNPGDEPANTVTSNSVIVMPPSNTDIVVIPPGPTPVLEEDPFRFRGCPAPWMRIQLADGTSIAAGELKVGMKVKTHDEKTMELGDFEVTQVQLLRDAKRLEIKFAHIDFVCSIDHKFYSKGNWVVASELMVGDKVGQEPGEFEILDISEYDYGDVVLITVDEAHTYICEGILSHNKIASDPLVIEEPPVYPFLLEFDPWFNITPFYFGINFTDGVSGSGYSAGNLFSNGGLFNGDNNWWASVPQITQTDFDPNLIPSNPITTQPITLTGGSSGISGYEDASIYGGGGKGDFDFGVWNNMER